MQYIKYTKHLFIIIVRDMVPGPLGLGPWPKQTLGISLSPSLMASPFCFGCMIDKPIPIRYDLVGDTFTRNSP